MKATAREAVFRYVQNLMWAAIREREEPGIVCLKCGTEQTYWHGSRCVRDELLGLPCDGAYACTAEAWSDPDFDPVHD
jgi:hypothetical protein